MTGADPEADSTPTERGPGPPPETGHAEVDAATARLAELDDAPLAEHHQRLAEAHDILHDMLYRDQGGQVEHEEPRDRDVPA
jgi:hypothetical protein